MRDQIAGPPRGGGSVAQQAPQGQPGQQGQQEVWGELGRRVRFLRRVGLFQGSPDDVLTHVAAALRPLPLNAGALVVREGEPGDEFFLIEAGTLGVYADIGGQQRRLAMLGPGEFFGEMALLGQGRRTATVRAETDAQMWVLGARDFHELLARQPEIDAIVRRAARLREASSQRSAFEIEHRNLAALAEGRQQIRIGRGHDNDLVFSSRLVSRYHAVVEWADGTYRLRDLGSHNGTYVNGVEARNAVLNDGDEIWVGDERFIFDRRQIQRLIEPRGIRIDVTNLSTEVKAGRRGKATKKLLHDISLSILPGEFVAVVGGSGAGKTTLLDAMSGVRPATEGIVRYNGQDYYKNLALYRNVLGYVPQDDIIHTALPVRRTLQFAAELRLPRDTPKAELDNAVTQAMEALDMTPHADTKVGSLSGGQRKRASIGVELLTGPRIFFLDEPTSGLDPATDAQMMRLLRRLSDNGSTVILTTHATKNVMLCDKVIFLARGGHLAFIGTPQRALRYFGVEAFDEIYEILEQAPPMEWGRRFRASEDYAQVLADQPRPDEAAASQRPSLGESGRTGGLLRQVRQFGVLARRNASILFGNRRHLIPMFMQPVVISLLLLALFKSGAFNLDVANLMTPVQLLYFMVFGAFFFSVTYSVQEICGEYPIFFRERMVNLGIIPYVLAKLVVLVPILLFVLTVMVGFLRLLGRLPSAGLDVYGRMMLTLGLTSLAALSLGLCASAIVPAPAVATRIQPLLIMPQVLFSGFTLAVPAMNIVGQTISQFMITRWAFEALGSINDLNGRFEAGRQPQGRALLEQYGDTFSRNPVQNWGILAIFVVVLLTLACLSLKRKSRQSRG